MKFSFLGKNARKKIMKYSDNDGKVDLLELAKAEGVKKIILSTDPIPGEEIIVFKMR